MLVAWALVAALVEARQQQWLFCLGLCRGSIRSLCFDRFCCGFFVCHFRWCFEDLGVDGLHCAFLDGSGFGSGFGSTVFFRRFSEQGFSFGCFLTFLVFSVVLAAFLPLSE